MDHITRCPNCATSFRVTDDQLAAHQGKVRCGRCAFVFNAQTSLRTVTPEISPAATAPLADQPELAADKPSLDAAFTSAYVDISSDDTIEHRANGTPPSNEEAEPQEAQEEPDALMETAEETPEQAVARQASGYHPIALPEDEALFAPLPKPRHVGLWRVATVLAAAALCLQILFAYRLTVAMEFPALQPRLAKLCMKLGCDMPLPRQPERLRLEWSELTFLPDHPTLIQLSATLRNLAQYEQAVPLLELTLTDNQERIVARRVFRPSEYLSSSEKNRSSLPAQDEMHAFLQLETGDLKSTGYSLYWFYE